MNEPISQTQDTIYKLLSGLLPVARDSQRRAAFESCYPGQTLAYMRIPEVAHVGKLGRHVSILLLIEFYDDIKVGV